MDLKHAKWFARIKVGDQSATAETESSIKTILAEFTNLLMSQSGNITRSKLAGVTKITLEIQDARFDDTVVDSVLINQVMNQVVT